MTWTKFAIRLVVAFLSGSALGLERQWRQRMAGLRTNTLVATGAALFVALFVILSVLTPGDSSPTRVAAQVVSGIGFLGGGNDETVYPMFLHSFFIRARGLMAPLADL
jgi:putative Mg2+ transporter-C (MgtC) family protein